MASRASVRKHKPGDADASVSATAKDGVPCDLGPGPAPNVREFFIPQIACSEEPQSTSTSSPREDTRPAVDAEILKLASLVLEGDLAGARAFVASLMRDGMSTQSVLLSLVGPVARMLQTEWLAEDCSFAEVAAALGLVHKLVSVLTESTGGSSSDGSSAD